MPHIEIKCYPGRTEEVKTKCAEAVAKVAAEALGCDESSVSVAITEVPKENWKSDVWDKEILPIESLYKKPGYTCE